VVSIAVEHLTKHFGTVRAVDDLTFETSPGRVTGFLGPNGAGKTTTLRMVLGLVRPTAGRALVEGRPYADLDQPLRTVGASLEAASFHPGRSGRDHLRVLAAAGRLPEQRVDEVLELVGLTDAAGRGAGGYSLGMRQRLALAAALLGDPRVLVLDEPANGLDPEGIAWLRRFLRYLAGAGRTVLVSSHVLSEVQQTVDDVVIISRGRLVRQAALAELDDPATRSALVRTPDPAALAAALAGHGLPAPVADEDGRWRVPATAPAAVGAAAFAGGVELHELTAAATDLEATFLQLTAGEEAA
jgi:ABC-2 type transport system ATP-binding protein